VVVGGTGVGVAGGVIVELGVEGSVEIGTEVAVGVRLLLRRRDSYLGRTGVFLTSHLARG
jgi:predicted nucleotidyltransferase